MVAPLISDASDGADSDLHDMCSQLDDRSSSGQLQEVITVAAAQEQNEQVLKVVEARLMQWSQAQRKRSVGLLQRTGALSHTERKRFPRAAITCALCPCC